MSRSRKRAPVHTIASVRPGKQKKWKRKCNRAYRKACREALRQGIEYMPSLKTYYNIWDSPSDGKLYVLYDRVLKLYQRLYGDRAETELNKLLRYK